VGSARIQVLHSIDIIALEEALLERIERRPHGGLLDPVLVIVPTRELVTHLKRRIAEKPGATLGVHLVTHRQLAIRAIEGALEVPPRELPRAALVSLVQELARDEGGADGEYLRAHDGAREALLATFADLRDAGVTPDDLAAARLLPSDCPPFVARIHARYAAALERLERQGWTDASGLARAAIPHVAAFIRRKGIRECIHHGAYELIGAHLELFEAAASAASGVFLLPGGLDGATCAYAARFAATLQSRGCTIEPAPRRDPARGEWTDRLAALHDPSPPIPPAAGGVPQLEIRHAQGPEAELRAAALRALALHAREGVPLDEIAIVARTLEPYAPYLDAVFTRAGIPFASSAAEPLSRDPAAGAFLALLRVLARGLERRAVIDLLRRPELCHTGDRPAPGEVDRWDRRSREARIAGGLDAWRELPAIAGALRTFRGTGEGETDEDRARAESERKSGEKLLLILEDLEKERREWAGRRTFEEHAAYLEDLARRRIALPGGRRRREEDGPGALEDILEAVEAAGAARAAAGSPGSPRSCPAAASIEEVEELARSAARGGGARIGAGPGVRVLDLMQARGIHSSVLIWLGFHRDLYPRQPRQDPFLSDGARARLRTVTGKPIAEKLHGRDEERLLLAMMLGAARKRFILSYQRAGESGGKEPRSSALREVARAFTGRADSALLLGDSDANPFRPDHVPAHPGAAARHVVDSPRLGFLHPEDAVLCAAVGGRGGPAGATAMLRALGRLDASRASALASIDEIEAFAPGPGRFDGLTGVGIDPGRAISPSAVERLAKCPLSFFLRYVLHLRELEDEAEPHRLEENVLGNAAHEALRHVYEEIAREELFRDPARAKKLARGLLEDCFRRNLAREAGPSARRLEGLFDIVGRRWLDKLGAFVERDIERLSALESPRIETEEAIMQRIDLGDGTTLDVAGYVDRLVVAGGTVRLDDYKTGKSIKGKLKDAVLLTGASLQLPLYREAVAARLAIDPLEIEARLLGAGPDSDEDEALLDGSPALRAGVLETVAVAVRLARGGSFPLHAGDPQYSHCGYCGYRRTCRRLHEPTLRRLESTPALEDFILSKEKKADAPTVAAVRERRAREAGEGRG
jgi:RecB family exonuclease